MQYIISENFFLFPRWFIHNGYDIPSYFHSLLAAVTIEIYISIGEVKTKNIHDINMNGYPVSFSASVAKPVSKEYHGAPERYSD